MRFLATYWKKREEAEGEGAEQEDWAEKKPGDKRKKKKKRIGVRMLAGG